MKMYDIVEVKPGTTSVEGVEIPDGASGVIMEFTQAREPYEGTAALVEFDLDIYPTIDAEIQIIEVQFLRVVSD